MVIVLMGVAGSGKSTVGQLLAEKVGWRFHDADDFHPPRNREKMRRGIPLDDNDRDPWLHAIRTSIVESLIRKQNAIYACSALKQVYRQFLKVNEDVKFIYLKGPQALIADRLAKRKGHFFDRALLQTQFNDLEEPRDVFEVDISPPPNAIAELIIAGLRLRHANISP
jgi:gluconokinase